MKKYLLFILFCLIIINVLKAQDTIVLFNNKIIPCKVTKIGALLIEFKLGKTDDTASATNYVELNKVIGIIHPERQIEIFDNNKMSNYFTELKANPSNIKVVKNSRKLIAGQTEIDHKHDSIKAIFLPPATLSIKISSLVFSGEIPLILEYRPKKTIGHVFSMGYAYINPIFGNALLIFPIEAFFCQGYNIKYGIRFYKPVNKEKTEWFYINPNIFYKQIWLNNIMHTDWGFHGVGSDDNLNYYYNLNKKVIGVQLLFGNAKLVEKTTFEYYFGFGFRVIERNMKNIRFESPHGYWGDFDPNNLPTSLNKNSILPSIQFGFNWNIPILRSK